ncbi:MAG: helix-turn-helix domain-containing protein, partial [Desulfobacterales bacterium]|nr:helix-turn-helix domain-containing protein [Desulfobacterales bacterium]
MEKNSSKPHINVDFFEDLTGDILASEDEGVEALGQKIKALRENKGMSLEAMSQMTGFDVETLSKIEKNEIQPQLGTVIKLSKALDSALGRLVSGQGDRLYTITRKGERKSTVRSTSSKASGQKLYTYKGLAPEVKGRHMEPLVVQLEEYPDQDVSVHEGEEFIFVLDGVVLLKIGEESFELEPGDSAYYLSTTAHLLSAKGGKA